MPEYLSPGVYVEEVDAGPKPIEGVSTSTAGAVGVTLIGPTDGKPALVTSYADFARQFGGSPDEPEGQMYEKWANDPVDGGQYWQFALSVRGFFDNGGQRLYVKRVIPAIATAAIKQMYRGLVTEIVADAAPTDTLLYVRHLFSISMGTSLTLFNSDTATNLANGTFTVIGYDPVALTVTLDKPIGQAIPANTAFALVGTSLLPTSADNPDSRTFSLEAKARGITGNNLQVRVRPMQGSVVNVLADPTGVDAPLKLQVTKAVQVLWSIDINNALVYAPNDVVTIKGRNHTVTAFDAAAKRLTLLADGGEPVIAAGDTNVEILKAGAVPGAAANSKITRAGTLTGISLLPATALAALGPTFKFNGDTYTVGPKTPTMVSFLPALPFGNSAVSMPISYDAAGAELAKVVANVAANVDPVLVDKDLTAMKQGDQLLFNGTAFTLTSPPLAAVAPAVGFLVKVDQPWVALPVAGNSLMAPSTTAKATVTANYATWQVEVGDASKLKVNDVLALGGFSTTLVNPAVGAVLSLALPADGSNAILPIGTTVKRLRVAGKTGQSAPLTVSGAEQLYKNATVELDDGVQKMLTSVKSIDGETVTLAEALNGAYYEGAKLRVVEAEIDVRRLNADKTIADSETFTNLELSDDKTLSYFESHLETLSKYIQVGTVQPSFSAPITNLAWFPLSETGGWVALENGDDKMDSLTVDDFVGADGGSGARTGIQAFEDIDDISICLAPVMWSRVIHEGLIDHCELRKDRFAILDPQYGLSIQEIRDVREPIDTKYAAIYYPWINVRDPLAHLNVDLAPSSHMAGIYARVDVERGVWKAPANEVILGINQISADVNKREQDVLNPININALRYFPDRGYRVWGARTLSSDSSWKYINVRRLFIYVEKSIDKGTQWVVFEPNDEPLWSRVRQSIANFLTTTWRSGALQGTKPEQAFYVKVDRTTMTQDDIDNGRLIVQIGIAPVKPAEFVIFRIQQATLSTQS